MNTVLKKNFQGNRADVIGRETESLSPGASPTEARCMAVAAKVTTPAAIPSTLSLLACTSVAPGACAYPSLKVVLVWLPSLDYLPSAHYIPLFQRPAQVYHLQRAASLWKSNGNHYKHPTLCLFIMYNSPWLLTTLKCLNLDTDIAWF